MCTISLGKLMREPSFEIEFRKCLFRWIPVFEIISIQLKQTGFSRWVDCLKKKKSWWMKKVGEQSYGAVCTCCFSSISLTAVPVSAQCCNNWCVFCGAGSNLGVSVSLATNPAHPLIHNPEYPQSLGKMQSFPRIHLELGDILVITGGHIRRCIINCFIKVNKS